MTKDTESIKDYELLAQTEEMQKSMEKGFSEVGTKVKRR